MSVISAGDKVRANKYACLSLREAGEVTVAFNADGWLTFTDLAGGHPDSEVDKVEIEPAEVEQASVVLDGQQDDGWWDAAPWGGSFLDEGGQQTLKQLKRSADRFGLEVRVQVRRVQS